MFQAGRPSGAETWFCAVSLRLMCFPKESEVKGLGFCFGENVLVWDLYRSGDNGGNFLSAGKNMMSKVEPRYGGISRKLHVASRLGGKAINIQVLKRVNDLFGVSFAVQVGHLSKCVANLTSAVFLVTCAPSVLEYS
ncbi:hypothetical protein AVEN_39240-1, partial [Araneus ventricosus]